MKRVGMTWRVDLTHWEEYKHIHLNPWPELMSAIQEHGIHNYSIFAMPPDTAAGAVRVFAYMEIDGENVMAALYQLAQTNIKKKWDDEVTVWVLPEGMTGSDVQFMEIEQVFYCP
jgi:L-rhamnose mutarotase